MQSKKLRFIDNLTCKDSEESDQSIGRSVETDITGLRKRGQGWFLTRGSPSPVMRFAFSRATTFPGTFDSHPSARGGFTTSRSLHPSSPPCSYRDWTTSKPSATNSVRLTNRPHSRICRIS